MKFQEVIDRYVEENQSSDKEGSLKAHKKKIEDYESYLGNVDMEEVFKEEHLRTYIIQDSRTPGNLRSALVHFYIFYYEKILGKDIFPPFPLSSRDKVISSKDNKTEPSDTKIPPKLLDEEQINRLFDDVFYEHLHDENAICAMKACIALCLSAGYDTGDFSPSNHTKALQLEEVEVADDYIIVPNYANQSTVPNIIIRGECANYIRKYYELRANASVNTNKFICIIWNNRKIKLKKDISKRKRYEPHDMLNYILKYISVEMNLSNTLYARDLRTNMVYHSLLNSSGASLHQIIEVFGFPPFVKYAFEKYCEDTNNTAYFGFNDFFEQPSSDEINNEESSADGEETVEDKQSKLNLYLLKKRPRNSIKVTKIKELYNNTCQVCGTSLTLLDSINYSEVHHIQPHGKEHNGMDDLPNMIVLCPNHHTLFDLGIIVLDPMNPKRILHIDEKSKTHNTELKVLKHQFSNVCVRYHYEKIFIPLKQSLNI